MHNFGATLRVQEELNFGPVLIDHMKTQAYNIIFIHHTDQSTLTIPGKFR